jgi:hypothetical protein
MNEGNSEGRAELGYLFEWETRNPRNGIDE